MHPNYPMIGGLQYGTETRGYMIDTDGNGHTQREAGWFYINDHYDVICRRIGGRRPWVYRSAADFLLGYCDDLTFVADPTAR